MERPSKTNGPRPTYSNPQMPEGINAEPRHPLKELAVAGGAALALVGGVIIGLFFFGRLVGPFVPFSWEVALADRVLAVEVRSDPKAEKPTDPKTERRLRLLADRLARRMNLPPGMTLSVHHVPGETVNAMATIGGRIFVFQGLLDQVADENARAFVLAHEIAHVKHRDVIRTLGGATMFSLAAAVLLGDGGSIAEIVGSGGMLASLHFSRKQEAEADSAALAAVAASFGDVHGIEELFEVFQRIEREASTPPEILRSHPLSRNRIARLRRIARRNGWLTER